MNHFPPFLLALALACALPAQAEKADRNKPLNAEADALRYDDLRQTSVFTGNVVITKGSIVIRGGRVEVTQTPDGFQRATITATPGQLAYYRSKRDGVDEAIEGQGELIEYDGRADTVQFTRQAVLRRYVGASLADETSGGQIRYDNSTDVFTVDGRAQSNRTAANPSGRVRATLAPRVTAAPAGAASSAPAAAPATPPPRLRPSLSLGGDKPDANEKK